MECIQEAWNAAERCSALQENESKRVSWSCFIRNGRLFVDGHAAKALGVLLPEPVMPTTASY
eukprot:12871243-Alexandrium_andersonii.AAC.1